MSKIEQTNYEKLPLGEIKPSGWLLNQLRLQADGLTGNIDRLWDELGPKSAWLGGKGEAWERGPYYLDGLVPLAYLLGDAALIEKAEKWVQSILNSQNAEGGFGPARTRDWWPRAVALKALVSYYSATGDKQIITFMRKFFKYMYNNIDDFPPKYWAAARAFEFIVPIEVVYNETGDEFLLDLVDKLKTYSYDWFDYFNDFTYKKRAGRYMSRGLINLGRALGSASDEKKKVGVKPLKEDSAKDILAFNQKRLVRKLMLTHGVNVAMAVKYPVLYGGFYNDAEHFQTSKTGLHSLYKYHGTATGMWTSDEHLNGKNPSLGIELCAVVELMYSLELMLQRTGDCYYADLLELLAFNTLPATFTPDMCAHQYVQQPNQVLVTKAKRSFFDVGKEGNIYGLKPNYGCCAANMHQGFPKFVENLCYKRDNELAFLVYAPCVVDTEIDDVRVRLVEETDYPFKNSVKFKVDLVSGNPNVRLTFRVPEYTKMNVFINGKQVVTDSKTTVHVKRSLKINDCIELRFTAPVVAVFNPDRTVSARRGSLLLASKLKTELSPISGTPPFVDYTAKTLTQWRVAPELHRKEFEVIAERENDIDDKPFNDGWPPLEVDVKARLVSNWRIKNDSAAPPPHRPALSDRIVKLTLVPYGATNLRISQFPVNKLTK